MLGIGFAIGVGGVFWLNSQRTGAQPEQFVTARVQRGDVEDSTTALGNLQPLEFVDVGTQVSGQLRKLHVQPGATVQQGDLLAEIDPTVYISRVDASRAQLMNLRAQLTDRESQLVLAEQQLTRQKNLIKSNATSMDAVQSAEAAHRSAGAQVEAIKAQIQQTESTLKGDEANLGYTKIYAPMPGTVVSITARQGQTLNANQQAPIILRIADLSVMTVVTQVSEADVAKLRVGMDAYFTTLGQGDRRWSGKLRQILPTPEVLNNVVLYNALFDVPNPNRELMTQMSAQVFFVSAAARDALIVPVAALRPAARREAPREGAAPAPREGRGEARARPPAAQAGEARRPQRFVVRVVGADDGVEDREITVGVTNRVMAEVLSGLNEGDRVVIGRQAPAGGQQPQRPRPAPRLS